MVIHNQNIIHNHKELYYMNLSEYSDKLVNGKITKLQEENQELKRQLEKAEKKKILRNPIALIITDKISKTEKQYYYKQKLMGLCLILISFIFIFSGILYDEITENTDATFLLLTIPLGLYMIFTSEKFLLK